MTAGGEGGARARPPPSRSAAGAELVLAGKVRSTSRAWPAERGARPVPALAAWGLPPACRPFPLAPRPFQIPASPLAQGVPRPWPGAVSCAHVTSFPGEQPASGGGWPARPCTPPWARAGSRSPRASGCPEPPQLGRASRVRGRGNFGRCLLPPGLPAPSAGVLCLLVDSWPHAERRGQDLRWGTGPGPARDSGVCNPCSFWLSRLV